MGGVAVGRDQWVHFVRTDPGSDAKAGSIPREAGANDGELALGTGELESFHISRSFAAGLLATINFGRRDFVVRQRGSDEHFMDGFASGGGGFGARWNI